MCFTAEGETEGSEQLYDWKRTEKEISTTGSRGKNGVRKHVFRYAALFKANVPLTRG